MTLELRPDLRSSLRANAPDLLRYFERRVTHREDAADLLSETMLTAWRRIDGWPLGDPTRQRMWLFGIAARTLSNHRRGRRRQSALVARLREQLSSTTEVVDDGAEVGAIRDAVSRLKQSHREVVILVHWDGFSLAEAAELLEINASTARSRYGAARALLRDALSEDVAHRAV